MRYDISKPAAPKMPILGKGTECIKILLSQASKDNYEPFVPMFFPVLGAHISGAEFQYPDNSWKEPTGMMANLVANSGDNKGQLAPLVEAICRDFRQHDKEEENKYLAWQKLEKSKGNNQAKPVEPERRKTMDEFVIRAYSKKELALMYFPDSSPRTAVQHMMSWIRRCTQLWEQLQATGYESTCKTFTPRQVRAIIEQLGEP